MAWSFVAGADQDSGGPPWTMPEPTGVAQGDVMITFGGLVNLAGTYSAPPGWTLIHAVSATAGTDRHAFLAYKIHDGVSASVVVNSDHASAGDRFGIVAFHNDAASTTIDVAFATANHYIDRSNNISASAPPITTSASGALVVAVQVMAGGPPDSFGAPSGWTQDYAVGGTVSLYVTHVTATAPGVIQSGVFTHANTSNDNDVATWTLAFAPATGGAPATYPHGVLGHPLKGPFGGPI